MKQYRWMKWIGMICISVCILLLSCGFCTAEGQEETTLAFDENHIAVRFGLLSDLHISKEESGLANQKKFVSALEAFKDLTDGGKELPLVLIGGDLIDWNGMDDIQYVKAAVEQCLDPKQTKLFITPGNHDAWCSKTDPADSKYGDKEVFVSFNLFRDFLPDYMDYDSKLQEIQRTLGYEHAVFGGVHFLSLLGVDGNHGSEALSWLKIQLNEIRESGNKMPVFVLTHTPASDTVVATKDGDSSSRWHSETLKNALYEYSEVVVLSGHTHAALDSADNVWQGTFTAINCGSLHLDEPSTKSACAFVEVDQNGIIRYTRYLIADDNSLTVLTGDPLILGAPKELGDTNGDGNINLMDALLALRHTEKDDLPQEAQDRIDMDGDGKISTVDAAKIAKKLRIE